MTYVLGILVFVAILVFSVAWHELGHFIPAKVFGVRVPQFMVGFGPTMFSRKRGGTEYGVKWLLLGGYIRMTAMYRPDPSAKAPTKGWRARLAAEARAASRDEMADLKEGEGRAFYTLSAPRKAIIMLGGPTMNLILAVVLFGVVISGLGSYQMSTRVAEVAQCYDSFGNWAEVCEPGTTAGPAAGAGVLPGDKVVSWNDTAIDAWSDLGPAIATSGLAAGRLGVERDGQLLSLDVTPVQATEDSRPVIGISSSPEIVREPISGVPSQFGQAVAASAKVYASLPVRVWNTTGDMIQGKPRDVESPLSMVGVARISGEMGQEVNTPGVDSWRLRWAMWLQLGAAINIALWLFNMLPLLPLDGGHVVNAIFEGSRRTIARRRGKPDPGPADSARLMPLTYAVVGLLVLMTVVLVAADIFNPIQF
ncbi:MAG: site-2 protease family protein [Micrococcales bacterium]|nr:site-2 protease family protein [Micrococcales bacterium]